MPMSKKETIYSRWEVADEDKKRRIFNEFKLKYRGCFTEKDLLSFLERKLSADAPKYSAPQ